MPRKGEFGRQSAKAMIFAGDKMVLGLNRWSGPEEPRKKDEPPKSRAEVRIYSAKDGSPAGELSLGGPGVIQAGLTAADGRLYVSCDDGTLMCFE